MAPSSRQLVRSAVGLAVVAPAIALLGLSIALAWGGGLSGVLAGAVLAFLSVLILGAAFVMTHAPVSISKLLSQDDPQRDPEGRPGTDGNASLEKEVRDR